MPASVTVQADLCCTWSETPKTGFSHLSSYKSIFTSPTQNSLGNTIALVYHTILNHRKLCLLPYKFSSDLLALLLRSQTVVPTTVRPDISAALATALAKSSSLRNAPSPELAPLEWTLLLSELHWSVLPRNKLELSENLTIAPLLSFFCRVKKQLQVTIISYHKLDLVNIDAHTKFGLIMSIRSPSKFCEKRRVIIPSLILSMMMCIQNLDGFCQFVLKILSGNKILKSIKGCNSVKICKK